MNFIVGLLKGCLCAWVDLYRYQLFWVLRSRCSSDPTSTSAYVEHSLSVNATLNL
jgi:hypothetical protein